MALFRKQWSSRVSEEPMDATRTAHHQAKVQAIIITDLYMDRNIYTSMGRQNKDVTAAKLASNNYLCAKNAG
jgi:hypothetical protein